MLIQKTRKPRGKKHDSVNRVTTPEYHQIQAKNWDGNLFLCYHFNGIEFIDCNLSECFFVDCIFEHCTFTDSCLDDSHFINCEWRDTILPNSVFLHCNNKNSTISLLKPTQNAEHSAQEDMDENKDFLPKKFSFYQNNHLESKDILYLNKNLIIQPMRKLNINTYFAKIKDKTTSKLAIIKSKG